MLGRAGVGRLCVVMFVVVFIAVTAAECLAEETRWWEVVGLGEAFLLTDFGAGHSPESWQAIYLGVDGASTLHILLACVDSKKLVPLMELYVPLDAFSRTATFTLVRDIDKQRFQVTVQPQADGLRVLSVKRSIGPPNEGKLIDSEASQGGEPGKPTSIESASTRKTPGEENTGRDGDQVEPSAQDPLEKLVKAPFDYSVLNGTITVTGKVTDEAGMPLKEACVYLIDLEKPSYISLLAFSNNNGIYMIPNASPGRYKIVFGKPGYVPINRIVSIDYGNNDFDQTLSKTGPSGDSWLTFETERTIYHYKEGQGVSDAEIRYQEERLAIIEDLLGVKLTRKIEFYMGNSREELSRMAFGNDRYAADAFFVGDRNAVYTIGGGYCWHETTHAVEFALNPNYNPALGEGLAVFFGWGKIGSPLQWRTQVDDAARRIMLEGKLSGLKDLLKNFDGRYTECGSFVTFLLKKYPIAKFRELFKAMPARPTDDEIDQVFKKIYGINATDMYNEWRVYLGGTRVNEGEIPERKRAIVRGTIEIEGLSTEDIRGKGYKVWNVYYKDEQCTKNAGIAGSIDVDSLPQRYEQLIDRDGEYYALFFLDLDGDLSLDENEPRAVRQVILEDGKTVEGIDVLLRAK